MPGFIDQLEEEFESIIPHKKPMHFSFNQISIPQ